MNVQVIINLASALIVFVGGLVIVFVYPGQLSNQYRVLIALIVAFYFLLRMGQTILVIRRHRRMREHDLSDADDAGIGRG